MKSTSKVVRKSWPMIRIVRSKGNKRYQVDARRKGTSGKRENKETRAEAETRAQQLADEFSKNGADGLAIPAELRVMALNSAEILKPYGKNINDATMFYKSHLDELARKFDSKTIAVVAEEWHNGKKNNTNRKPLAAETLKGIRKHSNILKNLWGERRIADITQADVQAYLDTFPHGRNKFNLHSRTSQFFNWCIAKPRNYIKENPAKDIKIEIDDKEVVILEIEKAENFMTVCETEFKDLTLNVAIGLFAGLRPTECNLLQWENVHIEERQITVLAETSKVSETRTVPIEDNLYHWLMSFKGECKGFVTNQTNLYKRQQKLRVKMGYKLCGKNETNEEWNEDTLRHTYASYWLGKYKQRGELAEHMGNSIEVIKKHYKKPVRNSDIAKFWEIVPASVTAAMEKARREADEQSRLDAMEQSNCGEAIKDESGKWIPVTNENALQQEDVFGNDA